MKHKALGITTGRYAGSEPPIELPVEEGLLIPLQGYFSSALVSVITSNLVVNKVVDNTDILTPLVQCMGLEPLTDLSS